MQDKIVEKTIKVLASHGISDKRYIGFVLDKMEYDGNWEPADYISAVFQDIIKEKNRALYKMRIMYSKIILETAEDAYDTRSISWDDKIKVERIWSNVQDYWEKKLKEI